MRIADIARDVATCVGAPVCYDKIYHTVEPGLAGLAPEQIAAERARLRAYKEARRGAAPPAPAPATVPR